MTTHVNLRSVLGRELTFAEGDQNFQNLQQAVDGISATGPGQGAEMVGYKAPFTGAVARTQALKNEDVVSVKDFGATGDGITDNYGNIQAAIDYAFANKIGFVHFPAGTYAVSKPLYLWGSNNYGWAGVSLIGAGVDCTTIKKTTNTTLNDGTAYAGVDGVIFLTPNPPLVSGQSATGTYNVGIYDLSVTCNSTPNTYGIYSRDFFGQIKMERVVVNGGVTGIYWGGDIFLSSFKSVSLLGQTVNGFWMNASGTSVYLQDCYVNGVGTGVAYHLTGLYSSGASIACEGFTGVPFSFSNGAQWTINGLGIECAGMTQSDSPFQAAVTVNQSAIVIINSALILAPSAFLCASGCSLTISGGFIGSGVVTARTGYLWYVAGTGKLCLEDLTNWDTFATPNTGFASIISRGGAGNGMAVSVGKDSTTNLPVTAGSFVVGLSYTILTVGSTNFTAIGAASNTVGVTFTATGVGSGTGTAYPLPFSTTAAFGVRSATADNGSTALLVQNGNGGQLLQIRSDGVIWTGLGPSSPYNNTSAAAANVGVDPTGILFRSTSSLKYKTNVQDATHGLTEVMTLRPVTYQGKSPRDGDVVFGGLIAEEVHSAGLTEFVQYADDGSPDALSYGHMVSLAFKAIQELKVELDAYKSSHP